ncbi:MAG: AAA family ATPase [Gammaproteobacteria bacterium]|jgi:aminoglycoside phosphotransferase family enzyme/predicted kinase
MGENPSSDESAAAELARAERLIEGLLRPEAYARPPTGSIELEETHAAWVVLAGDYAFKIKKPVDYGFLDYSTLDKRRFFCQEEIRLNRRFAPDIYLDVVAIRGSHARPRIEGEGSVLEYAVRMRRFPSNGLLSQLAETGALATAHIDQMIEAIAGFHRDAERASADSAYGRAERIHHWVMENFHHIRPFVGSGEHAEPLESLRRWADGERGRLDPLFERRRRGGFIRECHGDLHLGNLTLIHDRVTPFDCIEFNPELRWIDVMSDVAFLTMDLEDRGYPAFAHRFLNGYLQHGGDYEGLGVLRYYQFYRAMVRAKVAALRGQQEEAGSEALRHAEEEYRGYVALAARYTRPPHGALLITHGLSGSGKSTLARQLCEARGMIQIRSDLERKRLAGLAPLEESGSRVGSGLYTGQWTDQTYRRLTELADRVLESGFPVIVDATFLERARRERFQQLAKRRGVPFGILDCRAPEAELRRRIRSRRDLGADASEATLAVLDGQLRSREPLAHDETPAAIRVDTGAPDGLAAVLAELRARRLVDPGPAAGP